MLSLKAQMNLSPHTYPLETDRDRATVTWIKKHMHIILKHNHTNLGYSPGSCTPMPLTTNR